MSALPPGSGTFNSHPNVHFDTTTKKWTFESPETGAEFEFDERARIWVPVLTDEMVRAQQAAYSVAGVDETAPVAALAARESKKRKAKPADTEIDFTSNTAVSASAVGSMTAGKAVKGGGKTGAKGGNKRVRTADDGGSGAAEGLSAEASSSSGSALSTSDASLSAPPVKKEPKKSTAVYVTGLPLDTTSAEIASVFSKCGIILLGADDLPRVKLYNDVKTGAFKGEALVMYFKESSVELAERVMDDTEFRLGQSGRMRVKRAEWGDGDGGGDGESKADAGKEKSREKKRMTEEEKRALHARMRKMESSLTEWDSDDPDGDGPPQSGASASSNGARLVILKHMFTLAELEEDATLLLDLKEEVRDEAETMGEVTNVQVWDKEEEGIMTVRFKDPLAARACVAKFDGRFFAQRRIAAVLHDGAKVRFKRSGGGGGDPELGDEENEQEEKARLDKFRAYLEKDA